jgi:protein-S-isoprenylcysteine O-methyltransferase Ste14
MQRPPSATHAAVAASGLLGLVVSTGLVVIFDPFSRDAVASVAVIIAATAAFVAVPDLLFQKVHLRPSSGLDFSLDSPSWSRTAIKLLGLLGSVSFIGGFYWLLPEYDKEFYQPYFQLLALVWPYWAVLSVPYFYFIDRRMRDPADGYWHLGHLLLGRWRQVDRAILLQHGLGWFIKGFFMPLMFGYLCRDLQTMWQAMNEEFSLYLQWHNLSYMALYMVDVGLVCVGYVFSLRLLDSHLRAADQTLTGWIAALICYEPFWGFVRLGFLSSWGDFNWAVLFADRPIMLTIWSIAILALTAIYVWATVMFGLRFSNLTHRGIITSGPYRFTKHPAYVAKNIAWWMIALPFMADVPIGTMIQNCLLLLGINLIYLLRAKTEERLLGSDPVYVDYARWIDAHGMFRVLRNMPVVRFKAPGKATIA